MYKALQVSWFRSMQCYTCPHDIYILEAAKFFNGHSLAYSGIERSAV